MENSQKPKKSNIFTNEFQKVNVVDVINEINKNGYFAVENTLTNEAIIEIEKVSTETRLNINQNNISGVFKERQYFFTSLLAVSKSFYDLVTSSFVFETCERYMGSSFRLTGSRYYETYGKHHMQWHTDNKTDKVFINNPGLIFICYISDVMDGQFQYIKGSHLWSNKKKFNDYSDDFINKNYNKEIKNFVFSKGSIIIYNTHGIHRAKPVFNNNFIRKSVFFQIDNITDNSEPIVLNTKFIDDTNSKISMLLGFGKPSNYEIFPKTSLNTLPFNKNLFLNLIKYIPYRFSRNLFNSLPNFIKKILKNLIKK